ncbi:hypothetical protein KP509_03G037600 [Ceratopteris richardii]|uniref:Uncharacterized protein n=1 Tax=Ceratopteris richardii TaxID=49495 RepID=A0A8T2UYV3_CERRI|nr:hypothetical protein KP509_03G037600 [Ceratopteris richardii]
MEETPVAEDKQAAGDREDKQPAEDREDKQTASARSQPSRSSSGSYGCVSRRVSGESQDFEFNKLVGEMKSASIGTKDHLGTLELASADELFFNGHLLPLQYRESWSQPLFHSSPLSSSLSTKPSPETSCISPSLIGDQELRFSSSCRLMETSGLELSSSPTLVFSRSSSFRSSSSCSKCSSYYHLNGNHNCNCMMNLWDSSTGSSGDSGSSSRDSNGSSQDTCNGCENHRDRHLRYRNYAHNPSSANGSPYCKGKQRFTHSWRRLFRGLRRAPAHAAVVRGSSRVSSPHKQDKQTSSYFIGTSSIAACGYRVPERRECPLGDKHRLPAMQGTKKNAGSEMRETISGCEKGHVSAEFGAFNQNFRNRRSFKWQSYARKIKPISLIKDKLVGSHGQSSKGGRRSQAHETRSAELEDSESRTAWKQPLPGSCTHDHLRYCTNGRAVNNQCPSRLHSLSSSCPASARSSPSNSGLLSPPISTLSTMQEIQSAVQGAIAHCKQSISAQ